MKRRYFLTGCTGWIGAPIVRELCKRKDTEQIVLLTRNAQRSYHFYKMDKRIKLYEGNIVSCRFPEMNFTDIIHGSNESQDAPPAENYYTMVEGTNRILSWAFDWLAGNGGMVPQFLFLSSGAAKEAATSYGQGKRLCERLIAERRFGKIARIYTLVGENTPTQYAVGNFVRQAIMDRKVVVQGGENTLRSYLNLQDCAQWLLAILDDGRPLHPYDVGSDSALAIVALADLVADVFGVPLQRIKEKSAPNSYLPDLREMRALGCRQKITLRKSLEMIRDKAGVRNTHLETA